MIVNNKKTCPFGFAYFAYKKQSYNFKSWMFWKNNRLKNLTQCVTDGLHLFCSYVCPADCPLIGQASVSSPKTRRGKYLVAIEEVGQLWNSYILYHLKCVVWTAQGPGHAHALSDWRMVVCSVRQEPIRIRSHGCNVFSRLRNSICTCCSMHAQSQE